MSTPPEKLSAIALAPGWTMWSFVEVRGAGFATHRLHVLQCPDSVSAVEKLLDEGESILPLRKEALAQLRAIMEAPQTPPEQLELAKAAKKKLKKRKLPETIEGLGEATGSIKRLAGIAERAKAALDTLDSAYAAESLAVSEALLGLTNAPDFREAIAWQNRSALANGVDFVGRRPATATDAQTRKKRLLLVRYLQRYVTKNETIGFFGPFAWAFITDKTRIEVGKALLSERKLYFEHWGIDVLAKHITASSSAKSRVPPRLHPTLHLEDASLLLPSGSARPLPAPIASLIAACDGRSAIDIAESLASSGQLESAQEALELIEELERRQILLWSLELPPTEPDPVNLLRSDLARLGIEDGQTQLDALEEAARGVAAAAGDATALTAAFEEADACFTRLTGKDATRRAGQIYSGRTLLYEDCQRDIEIELDGALFKRIGAPLALIAISARWFTYEIARRIQAHATEAYDQLGGAPMSYAHFYDQLLPHIPSEDSAEDDIVSAVLEELQTRWLQCLTISDEESEGSRVHRDADSLRQRVEDAFSAPHPGWPAARHHSPDLMIEANGPDALQRGEALFVLGEIHTGLNQMTSRLTLRECPAADLLLQQHAIDVPALRIEPVVPKARCSRVYQGTQVPPQLELEFGDTLSSRPRDQVLSLADLVIRRQGERLLVESRDGAHRFDLIEVLEHQLLVASMGRFRPLAKRSHRPRITIDELVIAREQWTLPVSEIDFVSTPRGVEQLIAAKRWARRVGIPRCTFLKVPHEGKPVFLDLDCPLIIEDVAKLLGKSETATFTEMLPGLESTWLPHPDGGTCTAEIRLAMVDDVEWPVP